MSILDVLAARGAVLTDKHFVYAKGGHGPNYINIDPALPDVELMNEVCHQLGAPFSGNVDTVAAPATGGIPLAVLTALSLTGRDKRHPAVVWADKITVDGKDDFVFDRDGFKRELSGRRVLIVEDLLNTGGSVKQVVDRAREAGAEVVGVSVVCNRGPETAESLGVPKLHAVEKVDFQVFPGDDCPLCVREVPIVTDIGHGAGYQVTHPDYVGKYVTLLD